MTTYEILSLILETGVLVVLIIEFNFDKIQLEKEQAKKQRKRIEKPKEIITYEKDMD